MTIKTMNVSDLKVTSGSLKVRIAVRADSLDFAISSDRMDLTDLCVAITVVRQPPDEAA